mgnify:CR=1 FL=1
MIDFGNLQKMVDEKYISVQKHPEVDLWIYNYTQKAQFDRVWNEETLSCRGLILDKENNTSKITINGYPQFSNARYNERIEVELTGKKEDFDGKITWDVR